MAKIGCCALLAKVENTLEDVSARKRVCDSSQAGGLLS